jgi:radical SAM superfamily enzyme YgiQ (UPF0313 family)
VLIKPTSYDDDGFPQRYARGVLPSNSSAALHAATEDALRTLLAGRVPAEIHVLEDGIQRHARRLASLLRRFPEPGTRLVVGLVAVQTAQFPRACDLIDRWQAVGATCVIGGFHVSGSISALLDGIHDAARPDVPCPHAMPVEIQALMDRGVVVFHGEAEVEWTRALGDILAGSPSRLYRGGRPALEHVPLPEFPSGYFDGSFVTRMATFDTGRGCPFVCRFCTVINVQGRTPRFRDPAAIVARIEAICARDGAADFFFTDDNFARNPRWEAILDGLGALRARGRRIRFMVEADLACAKIPRFVQKLAAAGCSQVFMGVESVNPANLADAGKRQNDVERYASVWESFHAQGVMVHAAYIIGFPRDTPESVARDVETLVALGADQVSFFMLTLLPGSEDHVRAAAAGVVMDADFSRYDSFHPVFDHPTMSRDEWSGAYRQAWRRFYRPDRMIAALSRLPTRESRLDLLRNFAWYRWSAFTERTHPMIAGFYRLRPYRERRSSAPPLARWRHVVNEVLRHVRYLGRAAVEFYVFQHVYFEAEAARPISSKGRESGERLRGVADWCRRTFGRSMSRRWLNRFWRDYGSRRWQLLVNPAAYRWHAKLIPHALTEAIYTLRFAARLPRLVRASTGG